MFEIIAITIGIMIVKFVYTAIREARPALRTRLSCPMSMLNTSKAGIRRLKRDMIKANKGKI